MDVIFVDNIFLTENILILIEMFLSLFPGIQLAIP